MKIRSAIVALAAMSIGFGACKEDEAYVPFAFTYPKHDQVIWNTISPDFELPEDVTGNIEVIIEGTSLRSTGNKLSPLVIQTRSLADGPYTLVAKTYRKDGNPLEARRQIHVRNDLLQVVVPVTHIEAGWRCFLFLSNAGGETVLTHELRNGETLALRGPEDFNEPTFTVNEVYVKSPGYMQVFSVQEMYRGKWTLNDSQNKPGYIGSVNVMSQSKPSSLYYVSASGDAEFLREENYDLTLNTTQVPTQIFIREVGTPNNRYTLLKNISSDVSHSFALDEVTTSLTKLEVNLPEPDLISARVLLYGFTQPGNYNEYYPLGAFFRNQSKLTVEYPGSEFKSYGSESFYRNERIRLYSFQPGKKFDFKPVQAQVEFSVTNDQTMNLATIGDFDIYMTSWSYFNEQNNYAASWVMIGPSGRSQRLRIPDLPSAIAALVPEINKNRLTSTNSVQVSDYEMLNVYSAYLQYVSDYGISGPYRFGKPWKEQIFSASGFTNGRTSNDAPMLSEILNRVSQSGEIAKK